MSDVDIRGIFIPHRKFLLGNQHVDEFKDPNDEDTVYFSLEKFIRLALECNPNVVEQLFVRDEDILYMNDIGRELRNLRHHFISKNAFARFGSYAHAQLKRMDVWLFLYNEENDKTYKDLEKFSDFKSVKDRHVFACNTGKIRYYEEIPFHPERLLKDLHVIFHSGNVENLHYYSKLAE